MFKKILLSGSTGFLGNIIKETLSNEYLIKTIGKNNCNFIFDFSKTTQFKIDEEFDLIVHCAGKAHIIPKTEKEKDEFFQINTNGTQLLLESLNGAILPKSFVFISTVAVYGLDTGINIDENTALNAYDPYGKSKILAEKLVQDWCQKQNIICTILRLPLLVGANPKGNLAAMIKAIKKGYYFNIGGGKAQKSMVLAEDVANFITKVATIGGIYNLTDGHHPSFSELSQAISKNLGRNEALNNLPLKVAKFIANIGDLFSAIIPLNSSKYSKMTSNLTFDDSKARKIGWVSKPVIEYYLDK